MLQTPFHRATAPRLRRLGATDQRRMWKWARGEYCTQRSTMMMLECHGSRRYMLGKSMEAVRLCAVSQRQQPPLRLPFGKGERAWLQRPTRKEYAVPLATIYRCQTRTTRIFDVSRRPSENNATRAFQCTRVPGYNNLCSVFVPPCFATCSLGVGARTPPQHH